MLFLSSDLLTLSFTNMAVEFLFLDGFEMEDGSNDGLKRYIRIFRVYRNWCGQNTLAYIC